MNLIRLVQACCQNGSLPLPKRLFMSEAMLYAKA